LSEGSPLEIIGLNLLFILVWYNYITVISTKKSPVWGIFLEFRVMQNVSLFLGLWSILKKWIIRGCMESKEEMARMTLDFLDIK